MSTNKFTKKELEDLNKYKTKAQILGSIALVIVGAVAYGLLNGLIDFGRFQSTKAQNLTQLAPRIQYVFQHSTPGVVWLLFCMFYVISKRVNTPAVDPSAGHEGRTELAKNILTNSLEQFVMSFVSQLILVTHLEPKNVLNIIPTINLLFITGRILFFVGYPRARSLGFTLNMLPTFATIGYIFYKYIRIFV